MKRGWFTQNRMVHKIGWKCDEVFWILFWQTSAFCEIKIPPLYLTVSLTVVPFYSAVVTTELSHLAEKVWLLFPNQSLTMKICLDLFQLCLAHALCTMGSRRMSVALWVLVLPLPHGKHLICFSPFLQLYFERWLACVTWPWCLLYWFETWRHC